MRRKARAALSQRIRFDRCATSAVRGSLASTWLPALLLLLDAFESLFKLRDQRSLAGLEAVMPHDAPQVIAAGPLVRVIYGQQVLGRSARHQDNDVGLRGLVHKRESPNSGWRSVLS